MGKEKKQRNKRHKDNPTGLHSLQDMIKEDENLFKEKHEQTIERIVEQLNSVDMEEKLCGIQTLETMCCERSVAIQISRNEVVKILGPLLIDQSVMVRAAVASAFRSIADNGGDDAVANLLKNDIITPLAALLKRHYSSWRPNNDLPTKVRKTLDYEKETFLQAITLLWALAEKNDVVLKRTEEEDLLTVLMPFLNTQIYDLETSIAAIQCILTLSEENESIIEQIREKKDQVFKLLELETSDILNEFEVLMLKTLATGLIVNMYNGFSKNQEVPFVGKCLTILSTTLSVETGNKLDKLVEMLEKDEKSISNKTKKKLQDIKVLINAQIQAVEILANICTEQDYNDVESDLDDLDMDNSKESNDDIEPMNEEMEMDSNLCIEAIEAIVAEELVQKVLNKTASVSNNVVEKFQIHEESNNILKKLHILRCRSFLCLTNLMLTLSSETIGDVEYLYRIWSDTGKLVFNEIDQNDNELLDAATSLMRSTLQKINEQQANPFQQLTLNDLQPMLNGERQSSSPNVRANLINILGSLSLILVKSDLVHTGELVKSIVEFLLNSCMSESQVWVIAEAVDTIMDIFAEDETDQMALDINLIPKLTTISSILHSKLRQQKHSLGPNITIVSTVKANLGRFLKYKDKRVKLLRF